MNTLSVCINGITATTPLPTYAGVPTGATVADAVEMFASILGYAWDLRQQCGMDDDAPAPSFGLGEK